MSAPIRVQVAQVLASVMRGRSLDQALAQELDSSHAQAAFARALCYTTLRHGFSADALLARMRNRPGRSPRASVLALLRAALCELRFLATPAHALVSETVEAAKQLDRASAGFVNATLRRYLREREALDASLVDDLEARHEHPRWLIEQFRRDWPEDWQAICAAGNRPGPMWLRVDARQGARTDYAAELAALGIASQAPDSPQHALLLESAVAVERLPGFAEGRVSVQDGAAQRVVDMLAAEPGQRVLDACAAPGGKSAALAEAVADLDLVVIESDPARVPRLRDTLRRCRVSAQVRIEDAGATARWWDQRRFDRILIDAPCTGTGVISRHPDIKTLRRFEDIAGLAQQQARLLDALWPLLASGGRLVYATCSVLAAENQAQIEAFLQRTPSARALPVAVPGHGRVCGPGWQNLPLEHGEAGFFYACLQHSA